jgi:hypothetical protein
MALVAARTFVDMSAGQVFTLAGVEQYRVPYAHVPNAEACPPIVVAKRIRLRMIHYYDPATWELKGNWGNIRYIYWTRKTTRPFEMLPEVSDKISPKNQHLATHAWREKVKRRAVIDRAARKRKIVRDRSGVQNSAVVSRAPAVQALAASAFNYEAWKPWLRKVCEICELQAPEMLLLKDHITDHTQPPQRREKYSNVPWN